MSLRIATVGHVDHGKSTLIGRLLADTGQTRDDRQAKVRSFCESEGRKFEFAFLLDALEEEQAQGITIDVTEVPWNYAGQPFTFVDTPGHREFLKKMVGGASKVDAAILLVDVVEGIRDSLRRQLRVLDLLGVRNLILLVNKMDLVNWSEAAWLEREKEIRALLRGSKARIHVLPAAAWHGANLLERSAQMPWYEGPTLVEAMLEVAASAAKPLGPARFRVQDVYRFEDKRILVGRMESGELRAGDRLAFYPSGQESIVRSIEVYGEERSLARAGEAIGITLADPLYLDRGALGFAPSAPPALAHGAIADLFWLSPSALEAGASLVIKCGT